MAATLRLATREDSQQIRAIYAPIVERTVISFEEEVPSIDEMRDRIETTLRTHPWLVCDRQGEVLGYAHAGPHKARAAYRWAVEVTAYVRDDARGSGLGRALYSALLAILEAQGFVSAHAVIALPNPASVGFHQALGFRPVGIHRQVGFKLGAWHDVGWWQLELMRRPVDPAEPRTLPEVARSDRFADTLTRGAGLLDR